MGDSHGIIKRYKFWIRIYNAIERPSEESPRASSGGRSGSENVGLSNASIFTDIDLSTDFRLSILTNSQMRLAKLDELRQAAKIEVEMRFRKKRAELKTKVEMRVLLILKAYKQRRATLKERTSQSLLRRMARESKYKERVCTAICQKRVAAEKKRLALLETEKIRVRARVLEV
ncbi:Hypothetical predicted protein [Olea europaea subsp. europaea]|uniref:Uncharacterized protein n=1 Tax=Olea europaea subsp. europaea TaxID=158383 RepID=A0A8S0QH87_OLEEU|nr:Hypothetical predicted protein [Olea europaea subsp. europaea]